MTQKDHVVIARCLKQARPAGTRPAGIGREGFDAAHSTIDALCLNLAEALTADNPRFDFARFADACGESPVGVR